MIKDETTLVDCWGQDYKDPDHLVRDILIIFISNIGLDVDNPEPNHTSTQ